jgi:integrase
LRSRSKTATRTPRANGRASEEARQQGEDRRRPKPVLLAALTGLRFSETIGLRWEDVELSPERPKLRVTTQHYRGRTGEPKTRSARREIDLADQAVQVLRSQRVESTRENELGLVFPSGDGKHIHASNWNRRVWEHIRAAANLPDVHFHDLRSFFVSEAKAAGLAEPVTQQLVGHTDGRVHARYSYAVEGTDAITRRRLTDRFSRFTLE